MIKNLKYNPYQQSVAVIDSDTMTVTLNPDIWQELTGIQGEFVLWHEWGHIELDTSSEVEADSFAFKKLKQDRPGFTDYPSLISSLIPREAVEFDERLNNAKVFDYESESDSKTYNLDGERRKPRTNSDGVPVTDREAEERKFLSSLQEKISEFAQKLKKQDTDFYFKAGAIAVIVLIVIILIIKLR